MAMGSFIRPVGRRIEAIGQAVESDQRLTFWMLLGVMAVCIAIATAGSAGGRDVKADTWSAAIAADLLALHRHARAATIQEPRQPSRNRSMSRARPPGYAIILLGIGLIDPRVEAAVQCWSAVRKCGEDPSYASLLVVQLGLSVLALMLSFAIAYRLSGSSEVALLTLVLVFIALRHGDFAAYASSITWVRTLSLAGLFLAIEAHRRGSPPLAVGAGAATGAAALLDPLVALTIPVLAVLLAAVPAPRGQSPAFRLANSAGVLAGAAIALPLLGLAVAYGYNPLSAVRYTALQLAERAAFQEMDASA